MSAHSDWRKFGTDTLSREQNWASWHHSRVGWENQDMLADEPRERMTRERLGTQLSGVPLFLFLAFFCLPMQATSESPSARDDRADLIIEEIVSIGTRRRSRAAQDTPVPVDFFNADALESVNSSDLLDVISKIVPSFFLERHAIADGAAFIRPGSLRGLDSHHVLVLVNGKRRHRGALVRLSAFGPHGADMSGLPSGAIASMEILRDGAAALYGSDAIAGVINFNLKDGASGFEASARYGGYEEGDGEELRLEASSGFTLGRQGFLHVSAQYGEAAPTSRSQAYNLAIGQSGLRPIEAAESDLVLAGVNYYGPDAFTYTYGENGEILQVLPQSDGVPDDLDRRFAENYHRIGGDREFDRPAQIWGQPEREQWMAAFNAELPVDRSVALYAFGGYSQRDQTGGFFYRRPGVTQLFPVRLADGIIYDPRTSLYPSGFTPQFSGRVIDASLVVGVDGELENSLIFDLSASYGRNKIAYHIANTLNPSMGPETPTSFRPGDLTNDELALNADFTLELGETGGRHKHVAFGLEYRMEGYEIGEGGEASYFLGPFARKDPFNFEITQDEVDADPDDELLQVECRIPGMEVVGALCTRGDPIHNALAVGSNGFPGYPPAFASDYERTSSAAYAEVEVDVTDNLLVNLALRYEDFEDFGNVGIGKLAAKYALSESVNLRGSIGTGFRAPTPGQISTTNVSTRINTQGFPVAQGVFPADHAASGLFGGQPLDAEDSWSMTLGAAVSLQSGLNLTFDYYRIELTDRIVLSSVFVLDDHDRGALQNLQVVGATDIAELRFFTNDVDTRTSGIDLVVSYEFESRFGLTDLRAAINHNRTEVLKRGSFVDRETEFDIENSLPVARGNLTATQTWESFEFMLRARYYGKHRNAATQSLEEIQRFDAEIMFDAQLSWYFGRGYRLRIGAENLFDNYPQPAQYEVCCGAIYPRESIVPWQGRMVYAQVLAQIE